MIITTKFNLNDTVFFLEKNKVSSTKITNITTIFEIGQNQPVILYGFLDDKKEQHFKHEQFLFKTKQELLDSL